MEGLRDGANFNVKEFPSKDDQILGKYSGNQAIGIGVPWPVKLEKLPRSGLDGGHEKESTSPMMHGAPRVVKLDMTVEARPRSITHLSSAECRSGTGRGKQS